MSGDSGLVFEESLVDGCGGEIVVSHTRNLSPACDRNRDWAGRIPRNHPESPARDATQCRDPLRHRQRRPALPPPPPERGGVLRCLAVTADSGGRSDADLCRFSGDAPVVRSVGERGTSCCCDISGCVWYLRVGLGHSVHRRRTPSPPLGAPPVALRCRSVSQPARDFRCSLHWRG